MRVEHICGAYTMSKPTPSIYLQKEPHLPVGMAAGCLGLDGVLVGTSAVWTRVQCCGATERGMWNGARVFLRPKSPGIT